MSESDFTLPPNTSSDGELNFGTFVTSLATSALVHLGEGASEEEPTPVVNLPMAHQVIELIGLLREKTRGNLSSEEQKLIDELLYDLRLRYLRSSQSHAQK